MFARTLFVLLAFLHGTLHAAGSHSGRNGIYLYDRSKIRVVYRKHNRLSSRSCDGGEPSDQSVGPAVLPAGALQPSPGNSSTTQSQGPSRSSSIQNDGLNYAGAASSTLSAIPGVITNTPSGNITTSCTEGNWQCAGMNLQVCNFNAWVTLATCSGEGIVCSATGAVGCVWADSNEDPADQGAAGGDEDGESEDCDDDEDTEVVYASGSSMITTTVTIGQGLAAIPTNATNATLNTPSLTTALITATATLTNGSLVTGAANVTLLNASTGLTTPTATTNLTSILTATATATAVANSTSTVSPYTAPHWVVYADNWLTTMPSVSSLSSYNRFILAFWMSNNGPVDNAQAWVWFDPAYRAKVLAEYHAAGIALMVSAFGSTDNPTTWGYDPVQTAKELAAFVIGYGFDGVDIDYEDLTAMNNNQGEAWLISFQQELRSLLPAPYLITHAPLAPWFTSANDWQNGAYVNIHQTVGWSIDWYNVQFYNQGNGVYTSCETIIFQSDSMWPATSVFEMNSYAQVPLEKIVIGKPMDPNAADNGYVTPQTLHSCVVLAEANGWNAGVMFWEWESIAPSVMATVRGL